MVAVNTLLPHRSRSNDRRGVLLLIVLSMLTLFVMLGSTYLVVTMRARRVSQAFASKVTAPAAAGPTGEMLVDAALLSVLRGAAATAPPPIPPTNSLQWLQSGDDLLGDMYGADTLVGEITGATAYSGSPAFLQLTTQNLTGSVAPSDATELHGRVVTLELPGLVATTRVLAATGPATSPTIVIAAGPTVNGTPLSLALVSAARARSATPASRKIVINGREFSAPVTSGTSAATNEPWDAFDARNPLLTRIMPAPTSGVPQVERAPFLLSGTLALTVDSDSDGVNDTRWIDLDLPRMTDASGRSLQPKAAILVIDLDGRLNVNTHGDPGMFDTFSAAFTSTLTDAAGGDTAYPRYFSPSENPNNGMDDDGNGLTDDQYCWKRPPAGPLAPLRGLAPGVGSVATTSLAKSDAFRQTAASANRSGTAQNADIARGVLHALAGADSAANKRMHAQTDLLAPSRSVPDVGGLEGRYGSGGGWNGTTFDPDQVPRPGQRLFNDRITEARERWTVELVTSGSHAIARRFFDNPGRYGTPPDLKGRMASWADPKTGQPVFYKPYWDEFARNRLYDNEAVDDPYEVDLTPVGSRIAAVRNPASGGIDVNNPYTVADLEGLLRFYDPDSPRLSRRLVTTNDRMPSINRMSITTESWDSTAVVGDAWEQVIRSNFVTLLNSANATDFFALETIVGHQLDLNRPFHDTAATEPNDATGTTLRQQFARHVYCLLVGIAARNGLSIPMPADHARQLAQYAANVVDFRDADSTMTLFRYDPAFAPGSTSWAPGNNDFVWGCERPEVLITETYAWHDRNTDDESVGGSGGSPGSVRDGSDISFDQQRRPRGAFFVELTSPWGSPVYEYDASNITIRPNAAAAGSRNPFEHFRGDILAEELVSTEDVNGNGMLDNGEDANGNGRLDAGEDTNGDGLLNTGEDRNGNGVLDQARRNRLRTGIHLEKTVAATGDPVWRMVSVRGSVAGGTAFGTDPLSDATSNASQSIRDPAAPGSSAVVDRAFYFAQPPVALRNQIPGGVFWQAVPSATPLTPGHYRVVGTNAPLTPGAGPCPANVAGMIGLGNKPATLTEPLINSPADPYHAIMLEIQPAAMMTPDPALGGIAASWNSAIPEPLDAYGPATRPFPGNANVLSAAFMDSGNRPILMINGTHENFSMVYLQRLADPSKPWDNVPTSANYNPYVTVDAMPVDLNVVNSVNAKPAGTPAPMTAALPAGNHDDPTTMTARTYGRATNPLLSVQRGGYGMPADESDIWSRRVRASVADIRDANAFLSEPASPTAPNNLTGMAIMDRPLPPAQHTLDGQITGFRITNPGSGYTSSPPPSVMVTGGSGTGLNARAIVDGGAIVAIDVINGGSGYRNPGFLTVTITGGGGNGATAVPLVGGRPTRWNSGEPYASLYWPNRPFENLVEVSLLPVTSSFHLTQRHSIDAPGIANDQRFFHLPGFWETNVPPPTPPMSQWVWRYVTGRITPPPTPGPYNLLEFIHVSSRFANLYKSVPTGGANTTALQALGLALAPTEQLSSWREPGRININTVVDGEGPAGEARGAWRALFGAVDATTDADNPSAGDHTPRWLPEIFGPPRNATAPPGNPPTPARGFVEAVRAIPAPPPQNNPNAPPTRGTNSGGFLDDHTNATADRIRQTDRHAWSRYQTILNMSNRVTTRSNVYAVWVTIGYFDPSSPTVQTDQNELSPVQRNRGFFIIDRSIPVAYEQGKTHNARDTIRLRRIIQ